MSSHSLPDACLPALIQCLERLTHGLLVLPAGISDSSPAQALPGLIGALQAGGKLSLPSSESGLTLNEALALGGISLDLLATLRLAGASSPVIGETDQGLTNALERLSGDIGAAVRQENADRVRGLYVIIDPEVTKGRDPVKIAQAAVQGGARMLQLRDKLRDKGEILPTARALQELCQANDVLLIVNDHVDLASIIDSAGVHVGQTDMPVAEVRRVLHPHQVVGRSNHEFDELTESQEMGADHVAFGAIYETGTKGVGRPPQGVDRLREARKLAKVPLVAIGGINAGNAAPVIEAGADAICVTAAVGLAPEPEAAAARLTEVIRDAGGRV